MAVLPKTRNLRFENEPMDVVLKRGRDGMLNCTATAGRNNNMLNSNHVKWYKNNKLLKIGERKSLLENGTLLLSQVERSDTGVYNCKVTYRDLTIISTSAQFSVAGK